jgi:NADH-quinone oxidoreductase subunit A
MGSDRRDAMLKVTATAHKPGPSQQPGHPPGRRAGGPYDGSWSELNAYLPILVLGAIAAAFAVGSVAIASLVGPRRYNRSKQAAYECGIEPTETSVSGTHATAGQRFPVKYYLTAMLFIVFDIEIVFLYPWAVSFDSLGIFALVEMVVFMLTVFVAYAYVWRRGGLTWD